MASDDPKMARTSRSDDERSLAADPVGKPQADVAAPAAEVELALADLVADANGAVVFCNDSGFRNLAIRTDSKVVANGQAEAHVTAAGEDVSGFQYLTFDNGLTLFYEEGLHVFVASGAPAPSD